MGPEHLVPLKAKAWLDLGNRRARGKTVDSKVIRKHRNDVLRLYRILDPVSSIILSSDLRNDMLDFVTRMKNESIEMRSLDLGATDIDSILNEIRPYL